MDSLDALADRARHGDKGALDSLVRGVADFIYWPASSAWF